MPLSIEREVIIRALLRKPLEKWPRGEVHKIVAELLDEIELERKHTNIYIRHLHKMQAERDALLKYENKKET